MDGDLVVAKVPDFKWEWVESEPTVIELKFPESKKFSEALDKSVTASMLAMWNKNVTQASEAVQAMATAVNDTSTSLHSVLASYIETNEQHKKRQEEIDAKWRPWFESLTPWQNEVLARNQALKLSVYVNPDLTRIVTFPENQSESNWQYFEYVVNDPRSNVVAMLRRVPALEQQTVTCPHVRCGVGKTIFPVYNMIMHLNDDHQYTFIQIADWLDTLGIDFSFPID